MKSLYILGSGFSASCGLPTLSSLFTDLMQYASLQSGSDYKYHIKNVLEALAFFYPYCNEKKNDDGYPSFEEFLSVLTAATDFEDREDAEVQLFIKGFWNNKVKSALFLLTNFIDKKAKDAIFEHSAEPLKKFIDCLNAGDVILTFNWDTLIEQALIKAKRDFSLVECNPQKITILKLHGSLSWLNLPKEFSFAEHPYPKDSCFQLAERVFCALNHETWPTWFSLDKPPLIITPVKNKFPFAENLFQKIWKEAFNSIAKVRSEEGRIVIIGYSLSSEDLHARVLLRSGIHVPLKTPPAQERKVLLIDPDPNIAGRYYAAMTPNLSFLQRKFTGDELCEDMKIGVSPQTRNR